MNQYLLQVELVSDTSFGQGYGIPGLVDQDVALDECGCPYLHGRTLKGLLSEACAEILYAIDDAGYLWHKVADSLFGRPGSDLSSQGMLRVGHAQLPQPLRQAIHAEVSTGNVSREEIVGSLTVIRHQTAMDNRSAPEPYSLRNSRAVIRGTFLEAALYVDEIAIDGIDTALSRKYQEALLSACALGMRRAGTSRNRGRGRIRAKLLSDSGTELDGCDLFVKLVCKKDRDE